MGNIGLGLNATEYNGGVTTIKKALEDTDSVSKPGENKLVLTFIAAGEVSNKDVIK